MVKFAHSDTDLTMVRVYDTAWMNGRYVVYILCFTTLASENNLHSLCANNNFVCWIDFRGEKQLIKSLFCMVNLLPNLDHSWQFSIVNKHPFYPTAEMETLYMKIWSRIQKRQGKNWSMITQYYVTVHTLRNSYWTEPWNSNPPLLVETPNSYIFWRDTLALRWLFFF